MYPEEKKTISAHSVKTTVAAIFLALSTFAFALTSVLGVSSAGRIFFDSDSNTLEEGLELLAILIYFILSSAVTVIFSVVCFIIGVVLMRRTFGKQYALGKASVILSIIYVALPLLYVLILYFV